MQNINYKHYFYVAGLLLLSSVLGLWAWNTLSELFNWPHAQFKHALAFLVLFLIAKLGFHATTRHKGNHGLCHHTDGVNHE